MNDLISREALCEYALNQKDKSVTPNDIMRFPSAQPEIIRCKDCKHRMEHKHYGDFGESAYTCEGNMGGWILPDDFCSHAERSTDG